MYSMTIKNKFISKLPVEMKWDVKQPHTYFKSNLNNERQLSSPQRTMQINSNTTKKKRKTGNRHWKRIYLIPYYRR